MRNTAYFSGKKITVLGLARSGYTCASLLSRLGAEVSVSDSSDNESTRSLAGQLDSGVIKIELGTHSEEYIEGRDLVVISPGIPDSALPVFWAKQRGIKVVSEIEVAWSLCPAKVIAITGTNGKTTVTALIGKIIEASGKTVFTCGNIGNPFSGEVEKMREGDFVSLEVSSFQLEHIVNFKPSIAVILNVSRNHLDRYADMREYLSAKKRIFMNQDSGDYLVLNQDDPAVSALADDARSKAFFFSGRGGMNPNQAAVLEVGSLLGIDEKIIHHVFKNFTGIEHRMEYVSNIDSVEFINDSKATTVDSTMWALNNSFVPVILIAGGREKGNDYSLLADLMRKKVRALVVIGEAKDKIKKAYGDFVFVEEALTLPEAVRKAFHKAQAGERVLFSPMCKSFDMFLNYEERGKVFKEAVYALNPKSRT